MKTLRHILGLCALCGLLVSAPAYALGGGGGGGGGGSGGHGAPSEPAPEESMGRSLTHATSYVRMEPVRASVQSTPSFLVGLAPMLCEIVFMIVELG